MFKTTNLFLAFSIFLASAFNPLMAANTNLLQQSISEYKEAVYVRNVDPALALTEFYAKARENGINTADLLDYAKENSTQEDYETIVEMTLFAKSEVNALDSINQADLEFIFSRMMSASSAQGAHYRGCEGNAVLGVMLIVGAVVLAKEAMEKMDAYRDSEDFFGNHDESHKDEAILYGMFAGFTGIAGIGIAGSCN